MDRRCGGSRIQNLLNLGHCDGISGAMAGTDQELTYKTFSFRVKDATSGKHLVALGNATNTVWNYVNEISERSARRGPKWATKKQLARPDQRRQQGARPALAGDPGNHRRVHRQAETRAGPKFRWRVSRGRAARLAGSRSRTRMSRSSARSHCSAAARSGCGNTGRSRAGSSPATSPRMPGALVLQHRLRGRAPNDEPDAHCRHRSEAQGGSQVL